jgi:putative ABC transport system permease protein
MFFGAGFMLLGAGLIVIRKALIPRQTGGEVSGSRVQGSGGTANGHASPDVKPETLNLSASTLSFGLRNITRRPGRSLAVIGMMAGGIFLVIAVNAFRLGAVADPTRRDSGTGGFAFIGESTLPIYEDLNTPAAWDAFALDDKMMKQARVVPFRVREGDDASCLNLNKAQRPMLCAVNPDYLAREKAFSFVKGNWRGLDDWQKIFFKRWVAPDRKKEAENKDNVMHDLAEVEPLPIPAIADQATAMWGLGKGVGDTIAYTDAQGREFKVKLVGLLAGSVLQGKVIINEAAFLEKYPDAAGYKFFLVDAAEGKRQEAGGRSGDEESAIEKLRTHLTRQLEQRGLALENAADRLAAFSEVQNTYIGIFTVLGGLGVLLGTAGLGVLALRNVLERRGEFGLMQALGFLPAVLRRMVLAEHVALLVGGLVLGLLSAAIAVWPNVRQSGGALPFGFLFWLNAGILVFGIAVCWLAAALALRGRLLDAVRRE